MNTDPQPWSSVPGGSPAGRGAVTGPCRRGAACGEPPDEGRGPGYR